MAEQEAKTVQSVKILHLNDSGYGPEGKHTRKLWRVECHDKLQAGREQFEIWQKENLKKASGNIEKKRFDIEVTFTDGAKVIHSRLYRRDALDYLGSTFDNHVNDFIQHKFLCEAYFNYSTFSTITKFNSSTFGAAVDFDSATFLEDAHFQTVTFKGECGFKHSHFLLTAFFNNCLFKENVKFTYALFGRDVYFKGMKALKKAKFSHINVRRDTYYQEAKFCSEVRFKSAVFRGLAFFDYVEFLGSAFFQKVKFTESANFVETNFKEESIFQNSEFMCLGNFVGSKYNSIASRNPDFRGCKIDSTRLEFSDESHFSKSDYTEDAIKNISFLKRLSDEHGQTDQALNFNAMELQAKRKYEHEQLKVENHPETNPHLNKLFSWRVSVWISSLFNEKRWFCVVTWFYEYTSDFGRSYIRPFVILILLNVITFLIGLWFAFSHTSEVNASATQATSFEAIIAKLDQPKESEGFNVTGWRASTEYSLYRTGNFLDFSDADKHTEIINQRLFGANIEPTWIRIYGFFKGLASAFLVFLFALGLRNKYRVG